MMGSLPHHRSGPPGLTIEKVATVVPTRVLRTAKEASRELNIFFCPFKDKIMEKPLREGAREQPRGKRLGDSKERAWVRGRSHVHISTHGISRI